MAVKKKAKKTSGQNIRISEEAHKAFVKYCGENLYNIGAKASQILLDWTIKNQ